MSKPRLLIHIGVPKSGTTSLQFGAFPTHPEIRYIGKPFYDAQIGYEASLATAQLCDSLWKQDDLEFDLTLARQRFEFGVLPRLGKKLVVLSEEGLSQASAADRHLTAQRLSTLCQGMPCLILITIREQKSALFSGHNWIYARHLTSLKFNDWIEWCTTYSSYYGCHNDYPLRQYRYARLYEHYAHLFGPESVLVLPTELLSADPITFYAKLEDFAGLGRFWSTSSCPHQPVANRSPGRLGIAYQRFIKRIKHDRDLLLRRGASYPENLAETGIHGCAMKLLTHVDFPMPAMSSKTATNLNEYYKKDNARLAANIKISLKEYGYCV